MKPSLFLHFGAPKTGTTTLEYFFIRNKQLLLEKENIYYPVTPYEKGHNLQTQHTHLLLKPTLENWKALQAEVGKFAQECDIFVSSEIAFSSITKYTPTTVRIFSETFPNHRIVPLLYLKRHDDWFKSYFIQLSKTDHAGMNYADFFNHCAKNRPYHLRQSMVLQNLTSLFGQDNCLFRIGERSCLQNNDIIADVFAAIQKNIPDGAVFGERANPSIPKAASALIAGKNLPFSREDGLRDKIIDLLYSTFAADTGTMDPKTLSALRFEVDRINKFLPGYKDLFTKKELDYSFPELSAIGGKDIFICSLLYEILECQRQQLELTKKVEELISLMKR